MEIIKVEVQNDHLESLSHVKKPILAIAELIWNGLDADAEEVKVVVNKNKLGGIDSIRVEDNGHGLDKKDVINAFKNLGGSWKKQSKTSKKYKRLLHGKAGKGRFRAFAIGKTVQWRTKYQHDGKIMEYDIIGHSETLGEFHIGDDKSIRSKSTGTEVEIREIKKRFTSVLAKVAVQEITEHFSLYMTQYPTVRIKYDGNYIEPTVAMEKRTEYKLDDLNDERGNSIEVNLTIIEWKTQAERRLYLCDLNGFAYREMPPGIHASGFNFSAYLKADLIRELDEVALLDFEDWHPTLKQILEKAKKKMRQHFSARTSELRQKAVERWKEEDIYPYKGIPQNIIEKTERQVFDLCALNIVEYLPDFDEGDVKSKRLSFRLLQHALETSPTAARRILNDVLDLPPEKQEEFAELLEKTSLEGIVAAAKIVGDRLEFLRGLELLVFDSVSKQKLLERKQLHRIIAENTWLFGEEFHLSVDDQSLTEVLRKHLCLSGKDIVVDEPVKTENGTGGIVDLMLSRLIPQPKADDREHLVIEMKRPKQKIDRKAKNQIIEYAFAVAEDERFRDLNTNWSFWVVSNEISENVRKEAKQKNRPEGLLYEDDEGRIKIWTRTWGQIINDSKARLHFFQKTLNYKASNESAVEYLQKEYEKYLPACFSVETEAVATMAN